LDPKVHEMFMRLSVDFAKQEALQTQAKGFQCASIAIESLQNVWYGAWLLLPLAKLQVSPTETASSAYSLMQQAMKTGTYVTKGFSELLLAQSSLKTDTDIAKMLQRSVQDDLSSLMLKSASSALSVLQDP